MTRTPTAKALVLESRGAPFYIAELPLPAPAAGQALVGIRANRVNPLDTKIRAATVRARHPLPAILALNLAKVWTAGVWLQPKRFRSSRKNAALRTTHLAPAPPAQARA